jgi:hypothetical protein
MMKLVISDGTTKRQLNGPYRICASREDLQNLQHAIEKALATEGGFLFGWVDVNQSASNSDTEGPPIPFGTQPLEPGAMRDISFLERIS